MKLDTIQRACRTAAETGRRTDLQEVDLLDLVDIGDRILVRQDYVLVKAGFSGGVDIDRYVRGAK